MNRNVEHILGVWGRMPKIHVSVNANKLKADSYAAVARGEKFELPSWQVPGVHPVSHLVMPSYAFWLNVVNYNFNHPVRLSDGKILKFKTRDYFGKDQRGSFGMGACFYRAFGEQPILAKNMLSRLSSLNATKRFFSGYNAIPMVSERREMLLEAVEVLEEFFDGDPANIFKEAQYRAQVVIEILETLFPLSFTDATTVILNGVETDLNFQKRANLMVLMYQGRAAVSGGVLPTIQDIETVGPVPDSEVPRSYEADNIFFYSAKLYGKIDTAEPIEPGSRMELEIRMATVYAQYYELKWLNKARVAVGLPPLHIGHSDYYRFKKTKSRLPHLCFTTNY